MNLDEALPLWTEPGNIHRDANGLATVEYKFGGYQGPRVLKTPSGKVMQVPAARYERAIDPAGNIVPLVVCTNRGDREDPKNYDGHIMRDKTKKGWILIDHPPYGQDPAAHRAYCIAEIERRREAHAKAEADAASSFKTSMQALSEANSQAIGDAIGKSLPEIAAAVAAAMANANAKPKRGE